MPISPGTRLGPYEITSPVGAGGMGEVYRALDTRLDRSVAVKILPSDFAANPQLRLRFEREAKLISSLTHPNICTLHDVGETNGVNYLVMELLDGETLADRLSRGPLPMAQVLSISTQVASALERAHRQGIVHRDLKPANVMLTKSGVKLLDFGLAKPAGSVALGADDLTQQKSLTSEGTIVGTFQYMAPEQLEGQDVDARTDVFALGAVMYEMATGRRAFEGKTRTSLIAAIVQSQPAPISTIQPLTPPAFERLVAACLAKDPEERIQSAHDVLLQLQWIAAERPVETVRRRSPMPWLAALLVAALAAGIAGWALRRPPQGPVYSFTIPVVSPLYRYVTAVQISPDGRRLAFSAHDPQGRIHLWVQPLDSFEVRKLEATLNSTIVTWSPDSRSLYFSRPGGIAKVSADGGAAQPVTTQTAINGDVNGDGVLLLAPAEAPILRVDMATGKSRPITVLDAKHQEYGHVGPRFLPDGKHFLFVARTTSATESAPTLRLYAGSIDGSPARYLGDVTSTVRYADPGYVLYVREGALMAHAFDEKALALEGEPRVVLDSVAVNTVFGMFSVSDTGVLVVRPPRRQNTLRRVDATGRLLSQIGAPEATGTLRVSPDGERVAAAIADPKVGTFDIWAYGIHRPTQERVVVHGAHDQSAVWSRDGAQIFFSSDRSGYSDIYTVPSDGSGDARVLLGGPGTQTPYDVSPDGSTLIHGSSTSGGVGTADLYVLPLGGSGTPRPFVVAPRRQGDARFSPDGRQVAYLSVETGRVELYVRPFPGPGRARQISTTGVDAPPLWSRDGQTLMFVSGRRVYRVRMDANGTPLGEPELMFELAYDLSNWDLAPDGTFIMALATEERDAPPLRVVTDWPRLLRE